MVLFFCHFCQTFPLSVPLFVIESRSFLSFQSLFFNSIYFQNPSFPSPNLCQFGISFHSSTSIQYLVNFFLSFCENRNDTDCTVWPMILCKLIMSLTIPKMHLAFLGKKLVTAHRIYWTFFFFLCWKSYWIISFEQAWIFSTNNWVSWSLTNNLCQACKVFAWTLKTDLKTILHDSQSMQMLPLRNIYMKKIICLP